MHMLRTWDTPSVDTGLWQLLKEYPAFKSMVGPEPELATTQTQP